MLERDKCYGGKKQAWSSTLERWDGEGERFKLVCTGLSSFGKQTGKTAHVGPKCLLQGLELGLWGAWGATTGFWVHNKLDHDLQLRMGIEKHFL